MRKHNFTLHIVRNFVSGNKGREWVESLSVFKPQTLRGAWRKLHKDELNNLYSLSHTASD